MPEYLDAQKKQKAPLRIPDLDGPRDRLPHEIHAHDPAPHDRTGASLGILQIINARDDDCNIIG